MSTSLRSRRATPSGPGAPGDNAGLSQARVGVEGEAARAARLQHGRELGDVQTERASQFDGVVRERQTGGEQEIVHELGELARTQGAQQAHWVAERRQHRQRAFEGRFVAADHHQEAALGRRSSASAHRRVDHRYTDRSERPCRARRNARDGSCCGSPPALPAGVRPGRRRFAWITSCTSSSSTTQMATMSAWAASSAGDPAVCAAVEANGASVSARRAQSTVV